MEDSSNTIKQCPYCGEDIHVNAVKCPYCRTWLDGREGTTLPNEPIMKSSPIVSNNDTKNGLEDFLDRIAAHVTHGKRLQRLCIAAIVLSFYCYFSDCLDSDAHYRSGFLKAFATFDEYIGWLLGLSYWIIEICLLLALRMVLKRHNINSWISLCIVAEVLSFIFDLIAPADSFATVIPAFAAGSLAIEFGYKMYRSTFNHIKIVGLWEMIFSALLIAFYIMLVPWVVGASYSNGFPSGFVSFMALMCFVAVRYYSSLKKMFKLEYPENQ